jgi:PIN domain nuclease of toxin-antitoxin system
MKYLLDTHICLWAISDKNKLSFAVRKILEGTEAEILVSQISLWEIAIKYRLGKFPEFNSTLEEFAETIVKAGFTLLPLKNEHLIAYFKYPHFADVHKDPFDRLLLVTADSENADFITKDEKFEAYKDRMNIVW